MKKLISCIYLLLAGANLYCQPIDIYLNVEDEYNDIYLEDSSFNYVSIPYKVKDTTFQIIKNDRSLTLNKKDSIISFKYESSLRRLEGQLLVPAVECSNYAVLIDSTTSNPIIYSYKYHWPVRIGKWRSYQNGVYKDIDYKTTVKYLLLPCDRCNTIGINSRSQVVDKFELGISLSSEDDYSGIPLKELNYGDILIPYRIRDTTFQLVLDSQSISFNKKDSIIFFKYLSPHSSLGGQLLASSISCVNYRITFNAMTFDPVMSYYESYPTIRIGKWKSYQNGRYKEIDYNIKLSHSPYPYEYHNYYEHNKPQK